MIPYWVLIEKYALIFGFCPYLIAAQINTESSFQPEAISRAGARGLMQLMPETAIWLGVIDEGEEDLLFYPHINLQAGIRYDDWLRKYWKQRGLTGIMNTCLMLASYNAGPGRMRRAFKSGDWYANSPRETQYYVKRVFRWWARYLLDACEALVK